MVQEPTIPDDDAEGLADPLEAPDTSLGDGIAAGLQAVVSAIPVVGGPLAVAIDYQRRSYVSEKQNAFSKRVTSDLERLHIKVEDLSETFFGTMTYASWLATLTNEQDRVDAYENAVVNSALPNAPDVEMRELFLSTAASLTARHLRLLNCLFHPEEYGIDAHDYRDFHIAGMEVGGTFELMRRHITGLDRADILNHCLDDLISQGLVRYPMQGQDARTMGNPHPTELAHEFMAFINPPQELADADGGEEQGR
jgi:hypothetical protein